PSASFSSPFISVSHSSFGYLSSLVDPARRRAFIRGFLMILRLAPGTLLTEVTGAEDLRPRPAKNIANPNCRWKMTDALRCPRAFHPRSHPFNWVGWNDETGQSDRTTLIESDGYDCPCGRLRSATVVLSD